MVKEGVLRKGFLYLLREDTRMYHFCIIRVNLAINLKFYLKYEKKHIVYLHTSAKVKLLLIRIQQKWYFLTSLPSETIRSVQQHEPKALTGDIISNRSVQKIYIELFKLIQKYLKLQSLDISSPIRKNQSTYFKKTTYSHYCHTLAPFLLSFQYMCYPIMIL